MSYTRLIKEEIIQKITKSKKERNFELLGILNTKSAIYKDRIEVNLENISIAKRIYSSLKEITNLKIGIKYSTSRRFGEHKVYSVFIPYQKNYKRLLEFFLKLEKEQILKNESRLNGYIKGVFLATGYIKSPDKEYSMDFFIEQEKEAKRLYEILKHIGKKAFITKKKNKNLVYLRNSEDIMDLLIILGAKKSFFEYEEVTMMKEIKNKTIRAINWEIANEMKILNTAQKQLQQIKYIDDYIGLNSLSNVLQEIAAVRIENEEASLIELANIVGISKSGIRNRFRRIEAAYKKLLEEGEL